MGKIRLQPRTAEYDYTFDCRVFPFAIIAWLGHTLETIPDAT